MAAPPRWGRGVVVSEPDRVAVLAQGEGKRASDRSGEIADDLAAGGRDHRQSATTIGKERRGCDLRRTGRLGCLWPVVAPDDNQASGQQAGRDLPTVDLDAECPGEGAPSAGRARQQAARAPPGQARGGRAGPAAAWRGA